MPKRTNEPDGGRKAKRRRLYLAIDDWERGYSIREIDLSADDSDEDTRTQAVRLPPAVIRLEAPCSRCHYFAAIGTKMMMMRPVERKRIVPVFDVQTRGLSFGPRHKSVPYAPIYVPLGDKLFCLDKGCTQMLLFPSPGFDDFTQWIPGTDWVWSWGNIERPPFNRFHVTSHAVHPDGQTIFVSVNRPASASKKRCASVTTFTFDTECPEWKRHGEWTLPFTGRAYFDHELDAWVGLSGDPDTLGHIVSCNVVSADADSTNGGQSPIWKHSKERLFYKKPAGATLVHLEGRGQFCLVSVDESCGDESSDKFEEEEGEDLPQSSCHMLRLTTFSLKYDKNGDVRITIRGRVRSYKFPTAAKDYMDFLTNPVAFWI